VATMRAREETESALTAAALASTLREMPNRMVNFHRVLFCPTSKMSHDRGRHTKRLSRDCAGRGRWLWRLVRHFVHHRFFG